MKGKSIAYLSVLDSEKSFGVLRKIEGTIEAAKSSGFLTRILIIEPNPGFHTRLSQAIRDSNEDLIIIRSICEFNLFLIPALINARKKNKIIIFDVPTPNRVAIKELWQSDRSVVNKVRLLSQLILSGPVPYWFMNRVIQYSNESFWFSLGNEGRTKTIGNGISTKSIPVRKSKPAFNGEKVQLIMMASFNYWHGVDNLLRAIQKFNASLSTDLKVYLNLIGEGEVYEKLLKLVDDLQLHEYVDFSGILKHDRLFEQFERAHLAVGSLALYRKKLSMASELKSREYCALGIPFLAVGIDPDFNANAKFRIPIPNEKNEKFLVEFFETLDSSLFDFSPEEIRRYASSKLDFSIKFSQMTCGFLE